MRTKDEIREMVRARRKGLESDAVLRTSEAAQEILISLPEFARAGSVCCYLAMKGETRTDRIFEVCWRTGKKVSVPVFSRETGLYRLSRLKRETPMALSHFDILEPVEHEWMDAADADFVVVPGLAFDDKCGRVGHGKGYYDRILGGDLNQSSPAGLFKVGLAFAWQLVEAVPMDQTDVWMDAIVTENGIIRRSAV